MRIDVLTLFPEIFEPFINTSIIGRARDKNIIQINLYNIRDFSRDKHRRVDDYPYGGGEGMIMTPQPLFDAFYNIFKDCRENLPRVIYFSPQGRVLTQELAEEFVGEQHLVLLCGHYEGVDQRVIDKFVDEELSIGDYILTGGELPAMVFIDCVCRLVPGVLGNPESVREESFSESISGLLEYPQYTRPPEYEGYKVPDVLLSGNHEEIKKWRRRESLKNTLKKRPDLLKKANLTVQDEEILRELMKELGHER